MKWGVYNDEFKHFIPSETKCNSEAFFTLTSFQPYDETNCVYNVSYTENSLNMFCCNNNNMFSPAGVSVAGLALYTLAVSNANL
jgi:hypothetical protein